MHRRAPIAWKPELRYSLRRALFYGASSAALYLLVWVLHALVLLRGRWQLVAIVGMLVMPALALWYLCAALVSMTHIVKTS
jgi:hypothetical protein